MRLTKSVRQKIIENNEGFTTKSHYKGKNFQEDRKYTILEGKLHIEARGKSSWADSHHSDSWIANEKETHDFLYRNKGVLDTNGID